MGIEIDESLKFIFCLLETIDDLLTEVDLKDFQFLLL